MDSGCRHMELCRAVRLGSPRRGQRPAESFCPFFPRSACSVAFDGNSDYCLPRPFPHLALQINLQTKNPLPKRKQWQGIYIRNSYATTYIVTHHRSSFSFAGRVIHAGARLSTPNLKKLNFFLESQPNRLILSQKAARGFKIDASQFINLARKLPSRVVSYFMLMVMRL